MKDSPDSPRPRRLWGLGLVTLAALGLVLCDPAFGGLAIPTRGAILALLAGLCLLAYAALTPAFLSYALMLDLRLRERQQLELLGPGGRLYIRLVAKARSVDLTLPFLGSFLLFTVTWLLLTSVTSVLGGRAEVGLIALLAVLAVPLVNLLPVRWAGRSPDRAERLSASLTEGAVWLFAPLLHAFAWLVDGILLHGTIEELEPRAPEADLADVIEVGSHQGDLSIAQSELLRRELEFARTVAAEVMVPRVEVQYLDLDMSFDEARRVAASSRHSRFPVKQDSVDQIVAVLHVKTFLRHAGERPPETVRKLLLLERPRPPLEVAFDQPLESVLEALKRTKSSLAVVKDAYGGVAGILTVEDVVEELVGEIVDESDHEAVTERLTISGRRPLDELAESGIDLPGEPAATLSEIIVGELGEEPAAGSTITLGRWRLTVDALDAGGEIESVVAERVWTARPGGRR